MRTVFAFLTLLSLLLFAGRDVVAIRKDLGGYWKNVMDSQAMPEAIQGRMHPQTGKGAYFAKDFDPASHAAANIRWIAGEAMKEDHLPSSSSRPNAEKNSPISKAKP
ncbi:organ-specific protein P4-like [Corylus avellana]|uniref:organ-specific protein P4-like n=1 Tax=Corylus avellana TaxID=13451 RepID=UPI001E22E025|nr:organ-specific protein P4-like [Corylus avellana]